MISTASKIITKLWDFVLASSKDESGKLRNLRLLITKRLEFLSLSDLMGKEGGQAVQLLLLARHSVILFIFRQF